MRVGLASLAAITTLFSLSGCEVPGPVHPRDYPVNGAGIQGAFKYNDIPYGSDERQRLDLYMPKRKVYRLTPVVIYVHGGGWVFGDKNAVLTQGEISRKLADGWAVVAINYRLAGAPTLDASGNVIAAMNPHPAQIQDVKRAIRFIKASARSCVIRKGSARTSTHELSGNTPSCRASARITLDPAMIVVAGSSAGAHLAMLAGTSCAVVSQVTTCDPSLEPQLSSSQAIDQPLLTQNSRVDGVIAAGAPMDMEKAAFGTLALPLQWLAGCPIATVICDPNAIVSLAPMTYLDPSDPPIYFAFGPNDSLVPEIDHVTPYLAMLRTTLGDSRFWVDRMDGPAGRYLDLLPASSCLGCPAGDRIPEYYTASGHDTYFINATFVSLFMEQLRSRELL